MRLRTREVKWFAQGHTARKWYSWDSNAGFCFFACFAKEKYIFKAHLLFSRPPSLEAGLVKLGRPQTKAGKTTPLWLSALNVQAQLPSCPLLGMMGVGWGGSFLSSPVIPTQTRRCLWSFILTCSSHYCLTRGPFFVHYLFFPESLCSKVNTKPILSHTCSYFLFSRFEKTWHRC